MTLKRISTSMSAEEVETAAVLLDAIQSGTMPPAETIASAGFAGLCRVVQSMKRRLAVKEQP